MTDAGAANPYSTLPLSGSNEVGIGSAFVSIVEPHAGHERAYTRWYEDDHYYTGAMAFPWWFAGRRWVATKDLRALRYPEDSDVARPLDAGCYLSTYWLARGHHDDQARWLGAAVPRLLEEGRMFAERTHVSTGFYEHLGSVTREGFSPRDFQALDYPFEGIVVEVLDATGDGGRERLLEWIRGEHAPALLAESPAAVCVAFAPLPWPGHVEASWFDYAPAAGRRLLLLWFLERDPRSCWPQLAAGGAAVEDSGLGRIALAAPFIPTLPGTDRYLDELR